MLRVHGNFSGAIAAVVFQVAVFVAMTVASLISLPAAGRVSTAPKGGSVHFGFMGEEIPNVSFVGYPHGDSFGGIDYAAAADSQDEIYTFGTA